MLQFLFASYWYWFIAATGLLILEIILPGIFLVWLGLAAALVGLFLVLVPDAGPAWQLAVLAGSICLAVAAGLQWQKKLRRQQPNHLNQGLEGFIGRSARVSQSFQHGQGRIHLEDSSYAASSSTELAEGQMAVIVAVEHGKLVVSPQL